VTSQPTDGRRQPRSQIAPLVQAYLDADYRWELDGLWHPISIGAQAPALEAAFPEAREFGLLSAWNPYSIERPEAENRAQDEALHAALLASGLPHRAAFSSARNRTWREPSWIVMDMPLAGFDALAVRFGQLGTVHARRGEPLRLRIYHSPLDLPRGGALVDWVP
jgi:hypothetical protein